MKNSILLLIAAFATLVTNAHDFAIGGIYYNITSEADKQAEVTFRGDYYYSYSDEYSGSITIPATVTYNGAEYSVTSIGDYAFYECRSLATITIPEGVTSIGSSAFSGCSSLTAITLSEGVTSIGIKAFAYCSNLTAIVVAEGNKVYDSRGGCNAIIKTASNTLISGCSTTTIPESVTSIGEGAFYNCKSLTAINIPASVTSIGAEAFAGCNNLTDINIPKGVTSIGNGAFRSCSSLTAITIPEGVTSIGDEAFRGCSSLTAITIPEGVTSIGDNVFTGCSSLKSITIPEGVTSIGYQAFAWCSSLTDITIPESVTSIGAQAFEAQAFEGCSSLTAIVVAEGNKVYDSRGGCNAIIETNSNTLIQGCSATIIPESVTSIGDYAFYGCSSLTAITIPDGVTSIGNDAFYDCKNLTAITCEATTPPTIGNYYTFLQVDKSIPIYVPAGSVKAYKAAEGWSEFSNIERMAVSITHITLSQSSVTLIEGETITLTATVTPDDATDSSVTWSSSAPSVATVDNTGKVTAIAPGSVTITATANDGSGVSASCEIIVKAALLGKCATPIINHIDGEIILTCSTEGAEIRTTVTTENDNEYIGTKFEYIPTHTFTAYATKENYEDSDVATLTICWIPCSEKHESEETSILTIPSKPVLISARDGVLTLSGLAEGTEVTLYTTDGAMVAHQQSSAGEAKFTVDTNQVYLVHIGDKVVKIGM